jgi:fructuronate reductase
VELVSPDRPAVSRLSPGVLDRLPNGVQFPAYDRNAQRSGIVHFGIGAFHRAHQAVYTDDAMAAGDRDWAILGVSLRSPAVQHQLAPQSGLYSIIERGAERKSARIAGSVREVLVGGRQPDTIIGVVASSDTRILSFTITEKGYHRTLNGSLDLNDAAIAADLKGSTSPQTIYGFIRAGLAQRRAAGLPGLTLVCCDNLASNGVVLNQCVHTFLEAADKPLATWFAAECTCPSTMVDRIVPATTEEDLAGLAERLGVRDEAAVVTEPFRQWVIEDKFATPRPRWEAGGAQFVSDICTHELAKLRLLNGAHSALAYLGLNVGHRFVHEAISDPAIRPIIKRLMRVEASATLRKMPRSHAHAYCDRLIGRFENPRLPHCLAQIAMDGSQKIPQRWLAVLADSAAFGRSCPAILNALSSWVLYVRGDRFAVSDPLAPKLKTLWVTAGEQGIAPALFGPGGLFSKFWTAKPHELAALSTYLANPQSPGA